MKRDETKWKKWVDNNQPGGDDPSGYGLAILKYAEEWADNMEAALALPGKRLVSDVAKDCEPKGHGITGFMYGAAVATLADCWEYGDALRRWHNGKYGKGDADEGVVNPALLTLGGKNG